MRAPSDTDSLLEALNPEQRRVALHGEGPLMVLAGAGSGKTRAITHRIARLIVDEGVHPGAILAVTFTNKAAGEMAERVVQLLGEGAEAPSWISTFHSTCARILRREAPLLGLPRSFTILDEADQRLVLAQVAKDLNVPFDRPAVVSYRAFVERARNQGWLPEAAHAQGVGAEHEVNADVYAAYHRRLRRNATLDFGDLLLAVVELLETNERAGRRYQGRWEHVLVDEFQDTNAVQYRLLRLLVGEQRNLTVVGDDDQCIYTWRGALVHNLLGFEVDFPGCTVIRLEQNYRSTQPILDLANHLIAANPGRKEKRLWTENEGGPTPVLFTGRTEREEGDFVAQQIEALQREGGHLGGVAIFYRVNAQSRVYEEQLRRRGIPYRVLAGTSFYEREEVKDLLAYLRLAVNPRDDVACQRVANVPRRRVGAVTLERARALAAGHGLTLLEGLGRLAEDPHQRLTRRARQGIGQFVAVLSEMASGARYQTPTDIAQWLLEQIGYEQYLTSVHPENAPDRWDNVLELLSAMRDYEDEQAAQAEGDPSLAGFLERTALIQPQDESTADQAVNLMTIHTAKGLEFGTVFVTGLEEGLIPLMRGGQSEPEDVGEERRLCYVAVTRAKERLFLTNCVRRRLYGSSSERRPSRFLADLPVGLYAPAPGSTRYDAPAPKPRWRDSTGMPAYEDFDQRPAFASTRVTDIEIPADGLRFTRPTRDDSELATYVGRTATHRTFGEGRILSAEYSGQKVKLIIEFPEVGQKTVMKQYVEVG